MTDYELLTKGLQEVLGGDVLQKIAAKRAVKVYWGTAPTGRIHLGYYIPLLKIAEIVKAGVSCNYLDRRSSRNAGQSKIDRKAGS